MSHFNIALNFLVIALLGGVLFLVFKQNQTLKELSENRTRYLAADGNGRLITIIPLDEKFVDDKEFNAWVNAAISASLGNLKPDNYRDRLYEAQVFFNASGWQDFTTFLSENFVYDQIKLDNCNLRTKPKNIEVLREGAENGSYYQWKVRVSLEHNKLGCPQLPDEQDIYVFITRGLSSIHPLGLAINGWSENNA